MVKPHRVARRRRTACCRVHGQSWLALIQSLVFTEDDCAVLTRHVESGGIHDLSSQSWSSIESTLERSRFSEEMSDEVTLEQQRKEELAAMVPPSEGSVVSENSRRTEQWVDDTRRESEDEGWPNSNVTNEPVAEEGCSRAPLGEEESPSLRAADQDLTHVGGMSYAKPQWQGVTRGVTRICAYGKHKRVRPPMLSTGERRAETPRARCVAGSVASSQRSNGLQSSGVRTASRDSTCPSRTSQHRLGEMSDLLMARELRVETQINNLSNQMHTVLNAINIMGRERSLPRQPNASEGVQAGGSAKAPEPPNPTRAVKVELMSAMKPRTSKPVTAEVRIKDPVLTMPDMERKPVRVQMKGPHDSSSAIPSVPSVILSTTRDQGVNPMLIIYLDSSTEADLSSTKATLGSQTGDAAYVTAHTLMPGPSSLYLTADNGTLSGTPCACSTRKKEETMELYVQATHGSDVDVMRDVEPKEETEDISPEQLRFTAAISKAMSKELAPLLAGRDLAQTRPNVYRGSKDGSIDG